MKASTRLYIKRIVIGAAVATLPQVLLARGPGPAEPPFGSAEANMPPGLHAALAEGGLPDHSPCAMLPGTAGEPPWLHRLDLSEAQRDAIFELTHARQPDERALEKKAGRALDALQQLGANEAFDTRSARAQASDYAQAVAEQAFNRAQYHARLRALLTAAQRQQLDAGAHAAARCIAGAREHD